MNADIIETTNRTADGRYIQTRIKPTFNNGDGKGLKFSISDPFSTVFAATTDLTGKIIGTVARKKERKFEEEQLDQKNTMAIMQMLADEDDERIAKKKQENQIVIVSIIGLVLITTVIIIVKNK